MLRSILLFTALVTVLAVVPAFADQDCDTRGFVGTYTRVGAANDPVGNGELHASLFLLTFHNDGTVNMYWTGLPDYQINLGSGSGWFGTWRCRNNGNVLVNFYTAGFLPSAPDANIPLVNDIKLAFHSRSTYMFNINDQNTITRVKARSRTYAPADDPTDPNGGTLGALSTTQVVYKRMVTTDADLQLP